MCLMRRLPWEHKETFDIIPIMSLCGKCKTSQHFKLNEISCPDRLAVGCLVGMWRNLWWCSLWRLKCLRQPPSVTVDLWNTDASWTVTTAARFWLLHLVLNKSHEIRINPLSLFNVFSWSYCQLFNSAHSHSNVLCLSEDTFLFRWHHQPLIFLT